MLRFKEWLAEEAKKDRGKVGKAIKFYPIEISPKVKRANGSDRTRLEFEST